MALIEANRVYYVRENSPRKRCAVIYSNGSPFVGAGINWLCLPELNIKSIAEVSQKHGLSFEELHPRRIVDHPKNKELLAKLKVGDVWYLHSDFGSGRKILRAPHRWRVRTIKKETVEFDDPDKKVHMTIPLQTYLYKTDYSSMHWEPVPITSVDGICFTTISTHADGRDSEAFQQWG